MRYIKKLSLLAFLGIFLGITSEVSAQTISDCNRSLGEAFLDVNNVRARILNTGGLFYRGEPHVYEVPKGSGSNAIFASGIWIAGQVGGQLRAAATRYGEWEFWAGPLDDQGNPPADCDVYDRVYKVSRTDIDAFDQTGSAIPDLEDWPTGLGAPTLDANGDLMDILSQPFQSRVDRVVDLAAGERPAILGDQTIWWVMNDRGNQHESTDYPPIGLEAQGSAFAFDVAGDIGSATFYKFKLFYKGNVPLENTYLSIFSDPDLGDFADDYVGSDTSLGLGFVYNSDNADEGSSEAYGTPPPAAGYDFFQGPIVPSVGDTAKVSGVKVPDFKNLGMTSFIFYNNGGAVNGDPVTGDDYYNYMQANWKDGKKITFGGDGRTFSEIPTDFMYTGDPAQGEFWSEVNSDGAGTKISPGDRRFAMTTGPFTINPGDEQEIVFGLVFAKGADNLDSVAKLRNADALAQSAFDINFVLPQAPAKPEVSFTEMDGQIIIEWSNSPNSNNYLESYTEFDPFAPLDDPDYAFEGYRVIQYDEVADQIGKVIATYDVADGVKQVIDGFPGTPTRVTMNGNDNGVQRFHVVSGLTNYKTYYFGVQALAYNAGSFPKVFGSSIARFRATPKKSLNELSEDALVMAVSTATPDLVATRTGKGGGKVSINVVNPAEVIDADYQVKFYELAAAGKQAGPVTLEEGVEDPVQGHKGGIVPAKGPQAAITTYDVFRGTDKLFDGSITGEPAPQRANVVLIDGLSLSIEGPPASFMEIPPEGSGNPAFLEIAGPGDNYACGPDAVSTFGCSQAGGNNIWNSFNGSAEYAATNQGGGPTATIGGYAPSDFDIRFTDSPDNITYDFFVEGRLINGPFEVWDVGATGLFGENDPSDDIRMIPVHFSPGGGRCEWAYGESGDIFGLGGYGVTDRIYAYYPVPGETYESFRAAAQAAIDADPDSCPNTGDAGWPFDAFVDSGRGRPLQRIVFEDATGATGPTHPPFGVVIRFYTTKPNLPGDVHDFSTTGLGAQEFSLTQKQERLKIMGVVPNPYKGASIYETSQLIDQVRFTNVPLEKTTYRIFTLNGSLIETLVKPEGARSQSWNLTTENNLPIASGLYLIHVEVDGVGTKVIKFAVVKKRIQLNVF